jgi:hypothetical protein
LLLSIILNFSFQVERKCLEADIHSMALRLASLTAAAALAVVCSAAINFAGGPGIGLDFAPRITIHRRPDASEGEQRPVVVERKPHQILVLLGWRV